ncbi:trans-1,2-dihydrobenzene-1,2-diol dehydrogenase-like [Centruroides sculpturatus]|uniref:trans-1,2-dihydrobenzene-1,2-diol dehydrogenase-like n=1 Tax=Centruroides sculpturatus TaxID=218467 RepID=UPI000C6E6743|nr:trans-1,2-dihydrobenzene-1,2-diol dehydrogenase-like [Centruroides sculpturatus]
MEELKNIGDVYYIHSCFGIFLENVDRVGKKKLGGGTILDLGIYTVNAISMVYEGLKPKKIAAVGHLNSDGVDENMAASLIYENGKLANISSSAKCNYCCELVISGTKGCIKIPHPMWCPTSIITPTGKYDFPLPDTVTPCNFTNSSGLRYEAEEVRRCLKEGKYNNINREYIIIHIH